MKTSQKGCLMLAGIAIIIFIAVIAISSCASKNLKSPKVIASGNILATTTDQNQESLLYATKDAVFKLSLKELVAEQIETLDEASQVFLSPDGTKAISVSKDEESRSVKLVDLEGDTPVKDLDSNIRNLIWQSDAGKIIYHYFSYETSESKLVSSNPDGSSPQTLTDLKNFPEYKLSISNDNSKILYYSPPSDIGGTNLYIHDLDSKKSSTLFDDYSVGSAKFVGNKIIYEKFPATEGNYRIFIMDQDGADNIDLEIDSSIDKIATQNVDKFVIVASPETDESDNLYKINLPKKDKVTILESSDIQPYQPTNLLAIRNNNRDLLSFLSNNNLYLLELR